MSLRAEAAEAAEQTIESAKKGMADAQHGRLSRLKKQLSGYVDVSEMKVVKLHDPEMPLGSESAYTSQEVHAVDEGLKVRARFTVPRPSSGWKVITEVLIVDGDNQAWVPFHSLQTLHEALEAGIPPEPEPPAPKKPTHGDAAIGMLESVWEERARRDVDLAAQTGKSPSTVMDPELAISMALVYAVLELVDAVTYVGNTLNH